MVEITGDTIKTENGLKNLKLTINDYISKIYNTNPHNIWISLVYFDNKKQ